MNPIESTILTAETDHGALLAAGAALGTVRSGSKADHREFAIVPPGFELREVPRMALPDHPKALVKLRDGKSFARYFNEHKVGRSNIYATLEPAKFLAVFDDFDTRKGELGEIETNEQADWRQFRAEFVVPASREWKTWTGIDRKDLGQLAFAEFLQDNLPDVVTPDGTTLLEMCLNFEAIQGGKVVATQRLQDGSVNLQFQAENVGGASVKLPDVIQLSIPVFENEKPSELSARLRYRIKRDDGSITFKIELVRPHKVLEAAFRDTWARIEEGTGGQILLGTPE